MLKKWSCVSALVVCATVQTLSARNVFVTSGDPASPAIAAFSADPLSSQGTLTGPAGATQVLAGPGGKYYVLGQDPAAGIAVLAGTFPALQVSTTLATQGVPVAAAISPDGRRLVVVGTGVRVIDTATDTVLPNSSGLSIGSNPLGVAISTDSQRAFVLSQNPQRLYAINLETAQAAGDLAIPGLATAVSVGTNGLVYVSAQNVVIEIDPQTIQQRGTISLNGLPGPISFTPDGRVGIAPNRTIGTLRSAFILNLQQRTTVSVPPIGFELSEIAVASNSTAYARAGQTNQLYSINLANPVAPAALNIIGLPNADVRDFALSDEGPAPHDMFVLTGAGLYGVDFQANNVVGPIAAPAAGNISFAGPPATGAVASVIQANESQFVAPGANSLPLRLRALDAVGVPVAGAQVQFASTSGVTLSNASAQTNQQGFAQTIVTVPATVTSGVLTVSAAVGGQEVTYTLNVGSGTPGGGPGGDPDAPTGGLAIVKGQGQITTLNRPTTEPLTVIVTDAAGNPVPNVPITWAIAQPPGTLMNVTDHTDEQGLATANYFSTFVPVGTPYTQGIVSATTGTDTVSFIVTTLANLANNTPGDVTVTLVEPASRIITVRSGEVTAGAIQATIGSLAGTPIPNIGLRVIPDDPDGPTLTCRGGIPLSDATGTVVCDAIGGGIVGPTGARVVIGESRQFIVGLQVEAGSPSVLRIEGGNNQTATAGGPVAQPLTVSVRDSEGNTLPGADVTWEVVTPGSATLTDTVRRTDANGRASTRVTLGQTAGVVQIRARSGQGSVTFSITSNLSATTLQVTGSGQSAVIGQPFAQPVTATVSSPSGPVVGATVGFQLVSGSATFPASAVTNASGVASINVTAGQAAGPVQIRATLGSITQDIALTVRTTGPSFTAADVLNVAGFQPGISPGSIAYIRAAGIAPDIRGSVTPATIVGPLPTTLSGVEVLFNDIPSPIYSVSNVNGEESVVVQVPFEVNPGTASITIRTTGGGSTTVGSVPIMAADPGIFEHQDANGSRYAVALRPDGSYISSTNPARQGDIISVFTTGLGQTMPATATNRAGVEGQDVSSTVIAGINNAGVRMVSARLLEGVIGVYVVKMEIPADATTGPSRPLAVAVPGPDGELVFGGSAIPIQ